MTTLYDFFELYIIPYLFPDRILNITIPVPFSEGATISISNLISCLLVFLICWTLIIPLAKYISFLINAPLHLLSIRGKHNG